MPEILIRNVDPDLSWGIPGRTVKAVMLADLPDKSGRYEVMGSWLDLNLAGIKYQAPRERVRTGIRSVLVGDPGDWVTPNDYKREEYQYTEIAGIRSWPCIIDSELAASREGNTRRIIPVNRRGVGVQTISLNMELVIRLHKPVIDCIRDVDKRWIQVHNYPDYPEKSGTLDLVKKYWVVPKPKESSKPEGYVRKSSGVPPAYAGPSGWNPGAVI